MDPVKLRVAIPAAYPPDNACRRGAVQPCGRPMACSAIRLIAPFATASVFQTA